MHPNFVLVTLASAVAILVLTGLSALLATPRPTPPLTVDSARARLAQEFPDSAVSGVWLDPSGHAAVARASMRALVLFRVGDGYVARDLAWSALASAERKAGQVVAVFGDFAAPRAILHLPPEAPWPPHLPPYQPLDDRQGA